MWYCGIKGKETQKIQLEFLWNRRSVCWNCQPGKRENCPVYAISNGWRPNHTDVNEPQKLGPFTLSFYVFTSSFLGTFAMCRYFWFISFVFKVVTDCSLSVDLPKCHWIGKPSFNCLQKQFMFWVLVWFVFILKLNGLFKICHNDHKHLLQFHRE